MARKRKTANDLASVLKMSPHTAGSRLNAKVPFNVVEIDVIARWLDVDPATLLPSMQALAPSSPAGAA
ncbi:unannotated protein [freshwater metagenome]|uniref:Unannotated protein n=1 Tax=freshwater metagenome TaxID=449393 RepID=A0A6J6RZC1_9ZZZZ